VGDPVNRYSGAGVIGLSLTALLLVLIGTTQPPQPDEGALARIFQLIIVVLVPVTLVFASTADWRQPWRSARPLLIASVALTIAFTILYRFEHYQ
jgi:hypothetical protein